MMNQSDRFNDYINTHPRESLRFLVTGFFLVWQSIAGVLGIICYLVLNKYYRMQWWLILATGMVIAVYAIYFQQYYFLHHQVNLAEFIKNGFVLNFAFWKYLLANEGWQAVLFLYQTQLIYVAGLPLLMTAILNVIDFIEDNPHKKTMEALQKGMHSDELHEVDSKVIKKALDNLRDEDFDGTVLGVSKYTGKYLVINDRDVNQVVLVLGTTGAGKTITLRRFYQRAVRKGYPLLIVDGKPDNDNIAWLMKLAEKSGRQFYGFNCGNYATYDPLSNGGYTELKDKIISLKDEWSSDHYRSIAEDYLQATFQVLLKSGKEFDLKKVTECLTYENLAMLVRETKDQKLMQRVTSLERYDQEDITGLQAHLNLLIHSELGQYFERNDTTFTLPRVIQEGAVVYFALPALRFPSFSKVLGKLVINDIKAVVDGAQRKGRPIFTVFDEFSVFAGDQVLNLVNMGRGKNVHAVLGTQGVADLEKVDFNFKNQVLNCVNTLICHRLNDQESAESVASWVGTQDAFTVTAQLSVKEDNTGLGTVKQNKEFMIHPDMIKQGLETGDAFYISKAGKFRLGKVRVKYL